MNMPAEMVQFLKATVPLFAAFTDERLGDLVGGSWVASFEANQAVVHYGAEAAHFLKRRQRPDRHTSTVHGW